MVSDIIVAGLLTLDMIPDVTMLAPDNLTEAGKLFEIGNMTMSTGGAVSNTGIALHRLGTSVGLMGLVGDDWIGQVILDFLRKDDASLADNIQIVPNASSAYSVIIEPKNRDRTLLTHVGTNRVFGFDTLETNVIQQAKLFHLGYPTLLPRLYENRGDALVRIFNEVKMTLGRVTSLDMTVPDPNHPGGQVDWHVILRRTLPYVDLFIPSIEEILFMLRRDDYERWKADVLPHVSMAYLQALADDMLKMGCAIVGFKLGTRGLFLKTTSDLSRLTFLDKLDQSPEEWCDQQIWHSAFQVEVAGTTGAGDAAYAGFLSALLRGFDIEQCAQMACAVGACNVEKADATSGIRGWEETRARIDAGWSSID